jgi:general secretion pathway protein C
MSDPNGFKTRMNELAQNIRAQVQGLKARLKPPSGLPGGANNGKDSSPFFQALAERMRHFEPDKVAEWATAQFSGQNAGFYGKILTIVLCSYFAADLSSILMSNLLPEPPSSRARGGGFHRHIQLDDYNMIFARNLFSSTGTIPGEEVGNPSELQDNGGPPVRTILPFDLIGTMIMRNELRSIATIEDKTAQQVYPVRVQDEIPSKAKIVSIEARRVVFVNEQNHRREFVDLPEVVDPNVPKISLGKTDSGIVQAAPNAFTVSRSEVDRALSDLNNILTQARAIPNFENGQPAGYKLFQIVPGSIYQKLGLTDGDVICGFDGQPANDPAAAFEKLSNIKNTSHLDLCVKRGGKQTQYSYDFK